MKSSAQVKPRSLSMKGRSLIPPSVIWLRAGGSYTISRIPRSEQLGRISTVSMISLMPTGIPSTDDSGRPPRQRVRRQIF